MGQLERILSLRLLNYRNRPFYAFNLNGEDITMLFDSGASTPVWCMGENKLKRSYPDVVEKNEVCYISGFGKEEEGSMDLADIPCLHIYPFLCDRFYSTQNYGRVTSSIIKNDDSIASCYYYHYYCCIWIY